MNEQPEKAFQPIDLAPELERAQRLKDMLQMRNLDIAPRYEIASVMTEMNIRMIQYVQQFNAYSLDYLIIQTVNDFNRYVHPRYETSPAGNLLRTRPVAIMADDVTPIFANPAIVKSDYKDSVVMIFVNEIVENLKG